MAEIVYEVTTDSPITDVEFSNTDLPGPKGDTGDTGQTGLQGDIGDTGPQGSPGVKGDIGDTGPQGAKGDTGDTGLQGSQGIKGDIGNTGDTGPQGAQGVKGDTGDPGPQGIKGDIGLTGSSGSKGDTGDIGPIGSQGIKGDTGATGPQGIKGDTGSQGVQGATGAVGSASSVNLLPNATVQREIASVTTISPVSGTISCFPFTCNQSATITQITMCIGGTKFAGVTLARLQLGIWNESTKTFTPVAETDDFSAALVALATNGILTVPLANTGRITGGTPTSYTLQAGTRYAYALIVMNNTAGTFRGATSIGVLDTMSPIMAMSKTGQTDLPIVALGIGTAGGNIMFMFAS